MDVGSRGRARFVGGTWGNEVVIPGTERPWAVEVRRVNHLVWGYLDHRFDYGSLGFVQDAQDVMVLFDE